MSSFEERNRHLGAARDAFLRAAALCVDAPWEPGNLALAIVWAGIGLIYATRADDDDSAHVRAVAIIEQLRAHRGGQQ